jgi:hypothetical protein
MGTTSHGHKLSELARSHVCRYDCYLEDKSSQTITPRIREVENSVGMWVTRRTFLAHLFNADSLSELQNAESFAEMYWEDKIKPERHRIHRNVRINNKYL